MRLRILSDLHNEFALLALPDVDADVVVLAGDIDLGAKGLRWAADRFAGRTVVYVAGNHEYYGQAIPKLTTELTELGRQLGVTFLERGSVVIDGVRFLGCSLWTDFRLRGQYAADAITAEERMTDFRRTRVSPSFRRVRARDHAQWHVQAVTWLRAAMPPDDPIPTVVVTHHAPSPRSLAPAVERSPIDAAYACDLESLIVETSPRLWIHGHTHHCADYTLGQTRIVSNPRGYPGEAVTGFAADLVLNLDISSR